MMFVPCVAAAAPFAKPIKFRPVVADLLRRLAIVVHYNFGIIGGVDEFCNLVVQITARWNRAPAINVVGNCDEFFLCNCHDFSFRSVSWPATHCDGLWTVRHIAGRVTGFPPPSSFVPLPRHVKHWQFRAYPNAKRAWPVIFGEIIGFESPFLKPIGLAFAMPPVRIDCLASQFVSQ